MSLIARRFSLCAVLAGLLSCMPAAATTFTWDGDVNTSTSNSLNWNPNGSPGAADTITVNNGALANQPVLNTNITVTQTNVSAGTLTIDAVLTSSTVVISGTGRVVVNAGDEIVGNVQNGATLELNGTIFGNLSVQNGGTLLMYSAMTGNLDVLPGATLRLLRDAVAPVNGNASLGGTLAVDLTTVVFDQPVLTFDLLRATDISGTFASLALAGLDSDYTAATSVLTSGDRELLRLTLTEVPEPASIALLAAGLLLLMLVRRDAGSARRTLPA